MKRCAAADRRIRLDDIREPLKIGDLLERGVNNLSGGERQRVALGRARDELDAFAAARATGIDAVVAATHLRDAVVASGRWEKWRQREEAGLRFDELSADRQGWLVRTGCRYIWAAPEVVAARTRQRENCDSFYVPDVPGGTETVSVLSFDLTADDEPRITSIAACTASATSGCIPEMKYSRGTPTRTPPSPLEAFNPPT